MKFISINRLSISLACLLLCSCAIIKEQKEDTRRQRLITANQYKLENGMSKDQVKELFGDPCNFQFDKEYEAWQYCYTTSLNSAAAAHQQATVNNHYVIIWFVKGAVTSMTSYDNISESSCTSYFRTIHPEDYPGRVFRDTIR